MLNYWPWITSSGGEGKRNEEINYIGIRVEDNFCASILHTLAYYNHVT